MGKGYVKRTVLGGSQYEHRVVAGRALGRSLKRSETVHHVNGNKLDNRNRNLVVCSNAYHRWLHEEMARRWQATHFSEAA